LLTGSWSELVEYILAEIGFKMKISAKLALLLFLPGFAAAQHSVSLSWTASTSANVAGYRIYRGTTSGGPYSLLISSLVAGTSYTDTAVQAGRTYHYVATAVDVGNRESAYSNETQAVVPPVAIGITTLVCSPVSIGAPGVSTCTVTLTQAAPPSGSVVSLSFSNSAALTVPASVIVASGALSATFTVTAGALTENQSATVTATLNGSSQSATLSLVAAGCTLSKPILSSVNSASDFGALPDFASGSVLELKGANLASSTRSWAPGDFKGSNAPTSLDGTSSSINGIASFVYYISPTQIDVQAPADPATGGVPLTVTNCAGTSAAVTVPKAALAPGMLAPASFNIGGKQYLVALFQDGVTYVGNVGLIAGVPFRPAKPGDSITTYGVGFGSVTPSSPPGVVVAQANSIPDLSISFGSTAAPVSYAGLAVGAIGLYQFNLAIPQVADGDYRITVSVGSTQVQQTLYLTVHQ